MLEMGESLNIANQCVTHLLNNTNIINNFSSQILNIQNNISLSLTNMYTSMEDLITHFINWHSGLQIVANNTAIYIESPKGEFGVNLISNNTSCPARCKIRSPSYHSLQILPKLAKGHYLADLAALIGTIDIVFGEVDR